MMAAEENTSQNDSPNTRSTVEHLERTEPRTREKISRILGQTWENYSIYIVLVVLFVAGAVSSGAFLKVVNLLNILRQVSILGLISIGMTLVILTAGIDLSVGAVVGLTSIVLSLLMPSGVLLAVFIALLCGVMVGLVNGIGVAKGGMPPFIVTLGMMSIGRGLALFVSQGQVIEFFNPSFEILGAGRVKGIVPVSALIFLGIIGLASFMLRNTVFGRNVYAVGANEEAARLSGINVERVKIMAYLLSGLLASTGGLVYASLLTVGVPTGGQGMELDAIAAVVIGGTSFFGGIGSMSGTLAGVLIIGIINNVLNLRNISPYIQQLAKGVIILVAVYVDYRKKRR
ncbi:ABC transporter permease [Candidatus Aerophobetes bacterium]|uniref:ABC transporter permease n=1 Tax=Aerophobetes bacterium TaxID=2030807 RepID=A0A523QKL8_UNCAE|nr:MAG: ABC transporter permease [Candidatus Aerophobetes bacterium]